GQIAVTRHGIAIDEDAAEAFCDLKRQRRLAAGSRPCNKHRADCRHSAAFVEGVIAHAGQDLVRRLETDLSLIKPFRALRPAPGRASDVLAPPYDVLSSAEARVRAKGKPWSFLHISKPEIDLDTHTY